MDPSSSSDRGASATANDYVGVDGGSNVVGNDDNDNMEAAFIDSFFSPGGIFDVGEDSNKDRSIGGGGSDASAFGAVPPPPPPPGVSHPLPHPLPLASSSMGLPSTSSYASPFGSPASSTHGRSSSFLKRQSFTAAEDTTPTAQQHPQFGRSSAFFTPISTSDHKTPNATYANDGDINNIINSSNNTSNPSTNVVGSLLPTLATTATTPIAVHKQPSSSNINPWSIGSSLVDEDLIAARPIRLGDNDNDNGYSHELDRYDNSSDNNRSSILGQSTPPALPLSLLGEIRGRVIAGDDDEIDGDDIISSSNYGLLSSVARAKVDEPRNIPLSLFSSDAATDNDLLRFNFIEDDDEGLPPPPPLKTVPPPGFGDPNNNNATNRTKIKNYDRTDTAGEISASEHSPSIATSRGDSELKASSIPYTPPRSNLPSNTGGGTSVGDGSSSNSSSNPSKTKKKRGNKNKTQAAPSLQLPPKQQPRQQKKQSLDEVQGQLQESEESPALASASMKKSYAKVVSEKQQKANEAKMKIRLKQQQQQQEQQQKDTNSEKHDLGSESVFTAGSKNTATESTKHGAAAFDRSPRNTHSKKKTAMDDAKLSSDDINVTKKSRDFGSKGIQRRVTAPAKPVGKRENNSLANARPTDSDSYKERNSRRNRKSARSLKNEAQQSRGSLAANHVEDSSTRASDSDGDEVDAKKDTMDAPDKPHDHNTIQVLDKVSQNEEGNDKKDDDEYETESGEEEDEEEEDENNGNNEREENQSEDKNKRWNDTKKLMLAVKPQRKGARAAANKAKGKKRAPIADDIDEASEQSGIDAALAAITSGCGQQIPYLIQVLQSIFCFMWSILKSILPLVRQPLFAVMFFFTAIAKIMILCALGFANTFRYAVDEIEQLDGAFLCYLCLYLLPYMCDVLMACFSLPHYTPHLISAISVYQLCSTTSSTSSSTGSSTASSRRKPKINRNSQGQHTQNKINNNKGQDICMLLLWTFRSSIPIHLFLDGFSAPNLSLMMMHDWTRLLLAFVLSIIRANLIFSPVAWLSWSLQVFIIEYLPPNFFNGCLLLMVGLASVRLTTVLQQTDFLISVGTTIPASNSHATTNGKH